jgi:hypothetical protein
LLLDVLRGHGLDLGVEMQVLVAAETVARGRIGRLQQRRRGQLKVGHGGQGAGAWAVALDRHGAAAAHGALDRPVAVGLLRALHDRAADRRIAPPAQARIAD